MRALQNELLFLRASARTLLNFRCLRVPISSQISWKCTSSKSLLESTSWVGRSGRVNSYIYRGKRGLNKDKEIKRNVCSNSDKIQQQNITRSRTRSKSNIKSNFLGQRHSLRSGRLQQVLDREGQAPTPFGLVSLQIKKSADSKQTEVQIKNWTKKMFENLKENGGWTWKEEVLDWFGGQLSYEVLIFFGNLN